MIKVIAFDLDDTLWEMRPVLLAAEKKLDQFLKHTWPDLIHNVVSMRELRHEVLEESPHLAEKITLFRLRLIEKTFLASGYSAKDSAAYADRAMEVFLEARNNVTFFPDVLPALETLSHDYTLGSLTNGNADIRKLGLDNWFKFTFSAEEVGARKPAPDLINHALRITGFDRSEMIYVGDDLIQDIGAANAAGVHSIWINRRNQVIPDNLPRSQKPSAIIDRMGDISSVVRSL